MPQGQLQDHSVPWGAHEEVRVLRELPVIPWQRARRPVQDRQGQKEALQRLPQVPQQAHHQSSLEGSSTAT